MYCNATYCIKTMVCCVEINSLEITLILQLALSDVKIGPARAHGNGHMSVNTMFKLFL